MSEPEGTVLPPMAPPVRRPELVKPHEAVDVYHGSGDRLVSVRMRIMHGANFNDPQHFALPGHERMRASAGRRTHG